jgi:hypothetical protein
MCIRGLEPLKFNGRTIPIGLFANTDEKFLEKVLSNVPPNVNQESKILLIDLYDSSLNEHREPRFSDL